MRLANRGDTIVEVLIVLAILGSAIGISFSTAAHSLISIRSAEQNSTASEIVQSQLETVRADAYGGSDNVFNTTSSFCFSSLTGLYNNTITSNPTSSEYDVADYGPDCTFDATYYVDISYQPISDSLHPDVGTFTITAHWSDLSGEGEDSASLVYRVN